MEAIILVAALCILIFLGAPVGIALAVLPVVYILFTGELPLSTVPYQMYEALASPPLIAVPLFLLTGELMNTGNITDRLLAFSRELVGRIRGGLAQINIVLSMLFAGISGSAVADTATVGTIMIPVMKKSGYPAAFAAALTAIASTIGGIVPPSIAMILLASGLGLSVGSLFAAGILPGLLVGLLLMLTVYVMAFRNQYERYTEPFRLGTFLRVTGGALVPLLIPIVLVGGIAAGVFTATEAGSITVLMALTIGLLVYRSFTWSSLAGAMIRTTKLTGSIFFILAASGPFGWLLNRVGALQWLEGWLAGYANTPVLFALALVGFILLVGTVIEAVPAIVVLGPTLVQACTKAGYHPVQAGMVIVVGFILGAVSPPVGIIYFTAAQIADETLEKVGIALIPFMLVEVLAMFLLLWVPGFSLWLPAFFGFIKV
jgi:tripartite ATP-independent transporter DctM subunit